MFALVRVLRQVTKSDKTEKTESGGTSEQINEVRGALPT